MHRTKQSRRSFLNATGTMIGGSWLAWSMPAALATADFACRAREEGLPFEVLSAVEATELEAIAAQIIPTDETPGAREAGVIHFIDRALGTFMQRVASPVREGLHDFLTQVREAHPGTETFSALSDEDQIAALRGIESTAFFGIVRFMTLAGMFADPSYGGNRDKVGWQLMQFDDRHAWQPPFGYYDAQYRKEGSNDANP